MGKSVSTDPDVYAETTDHGGIQNHSGSDLYGDPHRQPDRTSRKILNEKGEAVFERGADIRFAVGSDHGTQLLLCRRQPHLHVTRHLVFETKDMGFVTRLPAGKSSGL